MAYHGLPVAPTEEAGLSRKGNPMIRLMTISIGVLAFLTLSACGQGAETCDSVAREMEKISEEIAKDPASAPERSKELEALSQKMAQMNCEG